MNTTALSRLAMLLAALASPAHVSMSQVPPARDASSQPANRFDPGALASLVAAAKGSVVTVRAKGPVDAQGTGFFVAPGRVLTCRHVLGKAYDAVVTLASGREVRVDGVVAESERDDLMLLSVAVNADEVQPLEIAPNDPAKAIASS